jgi:hypothetical protein
VLDLASILKLEPARRAWNGVPFLLARPSVADLLTLTEINARNPEEARLWSISRHLLDSNGCRVFPDAEAVKACPAPFAAALITMIEELYGEGLD